MARLNIPNFADYQTDRQLAKALYTVECVDAELMQTKAGNDQLRLRVRVVDGPAQEGGRSPVGTEVTDFIGLNPAAGKNEKAQDFIARKIGQLFAAFEITVVDGEYDEHEFVGKSVVVKIEPGEDLDGFPTDKITRYKKLS
jgi:hypothetical protein